MWFLKLTHPIPAPRWLSALLASLLEGLSTTWSDRDQITRWGMAPARHPPDNGHGAKNIQEIFRREESEEQNKLHSPGWALLFVAFYALFEGVKGMRQWIFYIFLIDLLAKTKARYYK